MVCSRGESLTLHINQMIIKKAFLAAGFFAVVSLMTACGNSKPTLSKTAAEGYTKCVVESKKSAAIMYEAEVKKMVIQLKTF